MKQIYRKVENRGNRCAVLDIQVSTYEDLPALGELFCNFFIQAGSHAEITTTGEIAVLDGNGHWYIGGNEI